MSFILNLRKPLACVLMLSLVVTGLITFTTRQSYASNKSLPRSSAPTVKEPSDGTGRQTKTVDEATRGRVSEAIGKLPLSFEENRGQVDKEVKYISRGAGYTLFLTPTEAVLALQRSDGKKAATADARRPGVPAQPRPTRMSVLRMKLSGANQSPAVTGESEMGVRTNYFKGNDPEKWQTDVTRYERVRYEQVYPGIDMIYYGEQQRLEYDFEVAPGADSRRIALEFEGVKRAKIERKTGELVLKTGGGEVRQRKPVAYQEAGGERREIVSRYVMQGQRKVGIEVGDYDRTKPLVIDPVLSYSTYLGGGGDDRGYGIAVDASGHAYVTGYTESSDFPTRHQYQTDQSSSDAFMVKLDTNSSGAASLLYSTILGGSNGSNAEGGYGITVDSSGIAYVTGWTGSPDFPVLHEYQTYRGGVDAFVTKLDTNASGVASLLYSTYLGGNNYEEGHGIAVDSSGVAYVAGITLSSDFPALHQYQTGKGAFVTKLDTNASGAASLLYSTSLGGSYFDYAWGIAIDASGNAYVAGLSQSSDFPLRHPYQRYRGGVDGFVSKLDTNASGAASLLYSTYLGGNAKDWCYGIAVDSSGNVYVTGLTLSTDFPKRHQYQTGKGVFVTKLNPNLSGPASLLYSTILGSGIGYGIALDSSGYAYVVGATGPGFPTLNEYQTYQGGADAFVTKLDTNASGAASLLYSTYLGGSDDEEGHGIAVDSSGIAYVTGLTFSTNFPTLHRYQTARSNFDAFVTKLTNSYTISGRVTSDGTTGVGGVIVRLSGSQTRAVVSDSTGYYSLAGLAVGGNYTITPSKGSLSFTPSEQSFTNLQADRTNVNFTTGPATISGRVTLDTADGAGLAGVTITLAGGPDFTPRTVNTGSDGTYSFGDVPTPRTYRLTPSKPNYSLSPTQLVLSNVAADQTGQNFVATLKTYTVHGVVKLGAAGLSGVTVKLTSPAPVGFTTRTTTTSSNGTYSFSSVPASRNYTVTPQKTGYQFTPTNQALADLSANQAVNFSVTVYSITGRIRRTATTTGINAVTVGLTSPSPAGFAARTARTDSAGTYTFTTLPAGRDYTIKPEKSGFTFSPATRSITNLSSNIPAGASTNFTGTVP